MSLFKVGMYKDLLARGLMGYHKISPFGPGPYLQNGLQINVFFHMAGDPSTTFPSFLGIPIPPTYVRAPEVPELCVRVAL